MRTQTRPGLSRSPHHPLSRITPLLALALLMLVAAPACAQGLDLPDNPLENPGQWLADQRWSELRYGLSVREPHRAKAVYDTPQGDSVRWAMPDGTRVRIDFARGVYETVDKRGVVVRLPAKVDVLKKQLGDELKASVAGQVINTRADQVVEVGDLIGIINYYIIKPNKPGAKPFLYGVALLQLDDRSVAVLRLESPPDQFVPGVCTFECMVHSIEVQDAKDVNRRLNNWLVNGETLLEELTQQDRLDAMRDDRLYRVLEGGRDIGYVRAWQRYQDKDFYEQRAAEQKAQGGDERLGGIYRFREPGNAVVVQSHFEGNDAKMSRLFEAIDPPDENDAYWQIKTSLRYENDPNNQRAGTWVETGIRGTAKIGGFNTDHIQVTREGTPPRHMVDFLLERERDPERKLRYPSADPRSYPSGDLIEKGWPVPRRAFLSIVDSELVPAMLPREAKTYAFSAYHPDRTAIDLRIMRVEPTPNGGKTVYLRPVIDQSPQVLTFDRNNELIRHTYPDGRELRKTTRQELARIWGAKLKD